MAFMTQPDPAAADFTVVLDAITAAVEAAEQVIRAKPPGPPAFEAAPAVGVRLDQLVERVPALRGAEAQRIKDAQRLSLRALAGVLGFDTHARVGQLIDRARQEGTG